MTRDDLTTAQPDPSPPAQDDLVGELALALAWSVHAPERVGEVAFLHRGESAIIGRAGTAHWMRHRPETHEPSGGLSDPAVSREQLGLRSLPTGQVEIERLGRLPVKVNGVSLDNGRVSDGDVIELGDRAVLVVHRRPRDIAGDPPKHPFGSPDEHGLVGEGPATWAVRSALAFVGPRAAHVLVHGPSGTGKELAARALHVLSSQSKGPLVSRSAATIPESLADAELFGNLGNYPNPGMAARPGLIGEADGGTLFLDEFGELPEDVQARFLRVLDAGEYTRLGEARPRRSHLRLVAATNRPVESLKHDIVARLPLRIDMPPLQARKEDVPLLAVHLLRHLARTDRELVRAWFPDAADDGYPRLTTRLVAALVRHPYQTHVRELSSLLWKAIAESRGADLDLFSSYADLAVAIDDPAHAVDPAGLSAEEIQNCLDRHGGRQELAWRELGLSSRHALARLVKKHGLAVRGRM